MAIAPIPGMGEKAIRSKESYGLQVSSIFTNQRLDIRD